MKFTKETLRRAGRTFLQAALSYIMVNVVLIDFSSGKEVVKSAVVGLVISALAAGFAAAMNLEDDFSAEGKKK
jgi:hypothetical protein